MGKLARATSAKSTGSIRRTLNTASVTLLKSSSQNLDLGFWAKVILAENRDLRMGIEEMRERIIGRIEETILSGGQPDHSECERLGVPTFVDLVEANQEEFCAEVVRKAIARKAH
jgi:hypothetical protein